MRNRRHVLHLVLIAHISEESLVPIYNEEDMVRVITSKDRIVSEIESVNKECISPKEYGIKKLGRYDIRRIKK